jgi:hypothetical protein
LNTEGKDWMMEKEWVELMVAFYRNVFDKGMNYNQAPAPSRPGPA